MTETSQQIRERIEESTARMETARSKRDELVSRKKRDLLAGRSVGSINKEIAKLDVDVSDYELLIEGLAQELVLAQQREKLQRKEQLAKEADQLREKIQSAWMDVAAALTKFEGGMKTLERLGSEASRLSGEYRSLDPHRALPTGDANFPSSFRASIEKLKSYVKIQEALREIERSRRD